MKEIWKDIEEKYGYSYEVSTLGRLRYKKTGFIRKDTLDLKGYNSQIIFIAGKAIPIRIHRAVAIAFIPNLYNKPQINHKNGIRNDNRIENLDWCTAKENMVHALFKKRGQENHLSKLTEGEVVEILRLNETVKFISEKFSVSTKTVTRIKNGKIWVKQYESTLDKVKCKLSWKINLMIANQIRSDHIVGLSIKSICEKYNIKPSHFRSIIQNNRWKI